MVRTRSSSRAGQSSPEPRVSLPPTEAAPPAQEPAPPAPEAAPPAQEEEHHVEEASPPASSGSSSSSSDAESDDSGNLENPPDERENEDGIFDNLNRYFPYGLFVIAVLCYIFAVYNKSTSGPRLEDHLDKKIVNWVNKEM
uniref:Protein CASC3 n=1 Tax=Panagrellus redivivus TaxID=6233 RepID=A0A7E4V7S4_PANRE